MNPLTRTQLDNIHSQDRQRQWQAFDSLTHATDEPVDWAYEAWDELLAMLASKDNHDRAIGGQLLSNLAKSDPKNRMLKDFPKLLAVTNDERFVTARHVLLSLWKVGAAGKKQQKLVVAGLERRFNECSTEKNCTLIRYDINVVLKNLYDHIHDEKIKARALALIETEPDLKYRKKYASVWRAQRIPKPDRS